MYTVKNYYSKLSNENKILMHFSHSFFISLAYFFFQILLNLFYSENEPNQIEWLKNSPQNPLNDLKSFQKKSKTKQKIIKIYSNYYYVLRKVYLPVILSKVVMLKQMAVHQHPCRYWKGVVLVLSIKIKLTPQKSNKSMPFSENKSFPLFEFH